MATNQTIDDCRVIFDRIMALWPKWQANETQASVCRDAVKGKYVPMVLKALDLHYNESEKSWPVMANVMAHYDRLMVSMPKDVSSDRIDWKTVEEQCQRERAETLQFLRFADAGDRSDARDRVLRVFPFLGKFSHAVRGRPVGHHAERVDRILMRQSNADVINHEATIDNESDEPEDWSWMVRLAVRGEMEEKLATNHEAERKKAVRR